MKHAEQKYPLSGFKLGKEKRKSHLKLIFKQKKKDNLKDF